MKKLIGLFILLYGLCLLPGTVPDALSDADKDGLNQKAEIVIVGGGISGLTAAYYLQDYDISVLEKRRKVGGRAFSLAHKEFVYAGGAEYLGKLYGPLKKISEELRLEVREIPFPMDVYIKNGQFYYGEMGRALLASKQSGLKEFQRFALTVQKIYREYKDIPELDMDSSIAKLDDITAYDWFIQNNFPQFFIEKYNVTFKGLFGANIKEISALSALTEIVFDFEGVDVKAEFSDLEEIENDPTPGKYPTGSYSYDIGIAQIPRAIAQHLENRIIVDATVTKVVKEKDEFEITFQSKDGMEKQSYADAVILATPAPVTLAIAGDVLSSEQEDILKSVSYAPFITLALYSSSPIFNRGFDLAVPDNLFFTDIYDATWIPRYYNPALKDVETFITTVYVSASSYKDRSILRLSDEEILQRVYKDLEELLPGSVKKVESHKIFRFEYGYPVMTPGAYKRLSRLHEITQAPVVLAGDYTIYPTLEAAADSGVLAAEKIIAYMEEDD